PPGSRLDDLLQAIERTTTDEQDVPRVDLDVFLLRVLPSALGRYRRGGLFADLQQRLLHPLARNVPGDGGVLALAGDLVDLVDVDDPPLALGHVEVRRLQQAHQDVLDILAHVARLGQRGRVDDGKGHAQGSRERLREQRLAHTGRADQQDVRLIELDLVPAGRLLVDPLVVVVDGDGEGALGVLLTDDVLVERFLDLAGSRERRRRAGRLLLLLLREDLVTQRDALVADVNGGSGDEPLHRVLRFAAEGAAEVLVARHGLQPRKERTGFTAARAAAKSQISVSASECCTSTTSPLRVMTLSMRPYSRAS